MGRRQIKKNKKYFFLKENGLIDIVQKRSDNKICGWYIKVHYIVSNKLENARKVLVQEDLSKNSQFQEVGNPRTRKQETNALRINNKCLIDININSYAQNFKKFYELYPRKVGKANVEKWFTKNKPNDNLMETILKALEIQKKSKQWQDKQFIPYPYTWLNQKRWEDELDIIENDTSITKNIETKEQKDIMKRLLE